MAAQNSKWLINKPTKPFINRFSQNVHCMRRIKKGKNGVQYGNSKL